MTPMIVYWPAIQFDRSSDDILVAAEMLLPEIISEHDFEAAGPAAGLFIFAGKIPAHDWLDPEHFEKFGADFHARADWSRLLHS